MLLIADSGSTKVDWRLIKDKNDIKSFSTPGINPYFQSKEEIINDLTINLVPQTGTSISEIHFYGAGVVGDKVQLLVDCFTQLFPNVKAFAYTDLLAAARSLCGDEPGIASIMGTGSNSCFYDGVQITDNVPASGFILGDEGSGAVLGKKLISDFLKRQMPKDLEKIFQEKYNLNYAQIVEKTYKQPFPNRYLATFTHFIFENRESSYIKSLLINSFKEFLSRNIESYNYKEYKLNFVGSVAYYFKEELIDAISQKEMKPGKIVQSPIDGLVDYHIKKSF